jgi:EAL and modified HD-GYP domain-containing signal transduction protein
VSIARNFLVEIGPPPVRPDRAVLQIAAYPAQDDLLELLQQLSRSGYTLALEGYNGRTDIEELMSLCSIVKVGVSGHDDDELARVIDAPRTQGALLVAADVEDHDAFMRASRMGFTYFQGEYFAKPRLFRHRGVATAGLGSLRQLAELTAGDASFEDLEQIISSDVGLSLKLLRYVNLAFFALPRSEMLAGSALPEERETLFTVGLFSVADALLDAPMAEVLDSLPFTDEIQTALLRREGPKGELLSAVTAYERGEFPPQSPAESELSLAGAYRAALEWADDAGRAIA